MRILLLNPCDDRSLFEEGAPLFGLLSIGTYLQAQGYDVYGIDLNYPYTNMQERYLRSPKNLIVEIKRFNPDICGISTFTHTRYNAYYWAKIVKELNKNTVIIFGGVHASADPIGILENVPQVDFVVIGEGEITMDELCKAIEKKSDFEKVKGIAFRNNGQIKMTSSREFINDINLLPNIDRGLFLKRETIPKIKVLEMMAGRGCPSHCKFCSSAFLWKGHRRIRSADNIIEELEKGLSCFPNVRFIKFRDETLLADTKIAFEIMRTLKKIGLPWECWSRIYDLDESVIKMMKSAGCWRVRIGIETGSKRLMRDLRKPVNLNKVPAVFNILRKYRLKYSPSFILGLPGSNTNDIYETLKLIKEIKTDPSSCTISMSTFLFPGTDYFEDFRKHNNDFNWEGTPEKYKRQPCVLDIYGNYLFPIATLPKEISNWKCHLLYVKATFPSHPIYSIRRLISLIILAFRKFLFVYVKNFFNTSKIKRK
jgi:radical SAM superfamily enzyme YgiQ (UPF0313 family)